MDHHISRCYVEKRPGFNPAVQSLQTELSEIPGIKDVRIRIFNRYDIQGLPLDRWPAVRDTILSEPMCDRCYEDNLPDMPADTRILCVESLPGQFDVRADSCEQCIQMLLGGERAEYGKRIVANLSSQLIGKYGNSLYTIGFTIL